MKKEVEWRSSNNLNFKELPFSYKLWIVFYFMDCLLILVFFMTRSIFSLIHNESVEIITWIFRLIMIIISIFMIYAGIIRKWSWFQPVG